MTIYRFYAGRKNSHITLDNKKTAKNNETIDLNDSDMKRDLIKLLINNAKNPSSKVDKLIKIEKPEKTNGTNK